MQSRGRNLRLGEMRDEGEFRRTFRGVCKINTSCLLRHFYFSSKSQICFLAIELLITIPP